jgi:hypothetical protein
MSPGYPERPAGGAFAHFAPRAAGGRQLEFADEAAHQAHGSSDAVRQFEAVYGPELVGGPVVFTDYVLIATNRGQ